MTPINLADLVEIAATIPAPSGAFLLPRQEVPAQNRPPMKDCCHVPNAQVADTFLVGARAL